MKKPTIKLLLVLLIGFTSRPVRAGETIVLDRLEASVNNKIILLSDIFEFRRTIELRRQLDPLFLGTPLAKKGAQFSTKDIVQFLVDEQIINAEFDVKDPAVEQEINSIQATNRITRNTLVSTLRSQGFSFDDYFRLIRISVGKRNLIDRDIRTKVHISDDDVKNYFYNQYRGSTTAPTVFHIQILTVTGSRYESPQEAKKMISRANEMLRSGEDFGVVAKRFSDHPTSAQGGDLGFLPANQISPAILRAVKGLKVGGLSPVLGDAKSQYFILKLADIKTGEEERLRSLSEEIRAKLTTEEYQKQIEFWLTRMRQKSFVHLAGDPSVPKNYGK